MSGRSEIDLARVLALRVDLQPRRRLDHHADAKALEKPVVVGERIDVVVEVEVVFADFPAQALLHVEDELVHRRRRADCGGAFTGGGGAAGPAMVATRCCDEERGGSQAASCACMGLACWLIIEIGCVSDGAQGGATFRRRAVVTATRDKFAGASRVGFRSRQACRRSWGIMLRPPRTCPATVGSVRRCVCRDGRGFRGTR